jgi:hypothetical protein
MAITQKKEAPLNIETSYSQARILKIIEFAVYFLKKVAFLLDILQPLTIKWRVPSTNRGNYQCGF